MEWYLPLIWAGVIGLAVAMYVILDGFDLGIGMLFPLAKSEVERDQMMHSIAPFWDGNETWLVLGGTGLLVAFPLAYGIIMPAFYVPVIIMLLALVFRGIAFEFRGLAGKKAGWNAAFVGGSTLATLCQGVILGGLVQGIKVDNAAFAGGTFEWATPFAVVCAFGVAAGYALLGATWLVMKTEGEVARRARAQAKGLLVTVLAFLALVSIWTPLLVPRIFERWFSMPNILFLWPVPLATAAVGLIAWRSLAGEGERGPSTAAIVLFLLGYLGLLISSFPYLVPPILTIWQTAAAPTSQAFMLMGTLVLLPMVLGYTAFNYWLFRGKVRADGAYH